MAALMATAGSTPMAPKLGTRAIPRIRPLGRQLQLSSPKWYRLLSSTSYTSMLRVPWSQTQCETVANLQDSMLEDGSIQHLISWSSTNDSFVMSPTSEFSKVLASVLTDPLALGILWSLTSSKPIFQAHQYFLLRPTIEYVRVSQRCVSLIPLPRQLLI